MHDVIREPHAEEVVHTLHSYNVFGIRWSPDSDCIGRIPAS